MKTNVNTLREIAKNCADVEFYLASDTSRPHTDTIKSADLAFNQLHDEIDCAYYVMDEEQYNNTICANCEQADFDEYFDDKNAKVLVILINEDSCYLKHEDKQLYKVVRTDNTEDKVLCIDTELTEEEAVNELLEYTGCDSFEEAENCGWTVRYNSEEKPYRIETNHGSFEIEAM